MAGDELHWGGEMDWPTGKEKLFSLYKFKICTAGNEFHWGDEIHWPISKETLFSLYKIKINLKILGSIEKSEWIFTQQLCTLAVILV